MLKPILPTMFALFISLTMSGCFGFATRFPDECNIEAFTTNAPNLESKQSTTSYSLGSKAHFLSTWGKPNIINITSGNAETWIYKKHLWCGLVPAFIIPVPLLLPVCDGFEHIEFQGDNAIRLHGRHIKESGFMFDIFGDFKLFNEPVPCGVPP